jgi:hypothetical protein
MVQEATAQKSCSECSSLINGTRTNSEPHEYLLLAGSSGSDETYFTCLLCNTGLTRHTKGWLTRWR